MTHSYLFYIKGALWLLMVAILMSGCSRTENTPKAAGAESTPSVETSATQTQVEPTANPTPTATEQPLAARVNGEGITLAEYQAELARFQQASGRELSEADRQRVMNDLINQVLLVQAAAEKGFFLDENQLQIRLDNLTEQVGGEQALADWLQANGYTEEEFRLQLARAAEAAWMRDWIAGEVPTTADQVHVRQILTRTAEAANQAYARLQAGEDFATIAKNTDPITAGELGWFPRGILFFPELDEAIFSLDPGQYTPIIQTTSGYHIVFVIARDPEHTLDSQALLQFQEEALQRWLVDRRQQSQIEMLAPAG